MLFYRLYQAKQRAVQKLNEFQFIAENCRRLRDGQKLLVDKRRKFWMDCGRYFPPLYPSPKPAPRNTYERFFAYGTKENDLLRIIISFIICEIAGIIFFISIALRFSTFPSRLGVYISIITQCILGMMIPFPSLRALILIALTKLTTSQLRAIILMFLLSWAFHVPAMNTTHNLELLAESVSCIRGSAIKVGNKLVDEMNMQTNKFSLLGLRETALFFIQHMINFRNMVRKLQDVVGRFGKQWKDYLVQLLAVKTNCQRFFIGPYYFCIQIFDNAAQKCDRLTLFRGMPSCLFIKNMKKICDAARFGEMVCVIPGKIKESLKNGILAQAKDKMKTTLANIMGGVNMTFLVKEAKLAKRSWEELGITLNLTRQSSHAKTIDVDAMKEELQNILEQFKFSVDILLTIIKIIICNMVIRVFILSIWYIIRYKRKEKTDNYYITEEFRKIDLLREAQGQPSLLPLLPKERNLYTEGFTFHMTVKEKMRMIFAFAITLIGGFLPMFIIILDVFNYHILYFTYSFLQSKSTRTDRLDFYNLKVSGVGFLSSLLGRVLQIFNPITGNQYSDDDWRSCFKEPSPPDYLLIRLMVLLYIFAIVLCVLQIYVGRFRRLIAQHYWPERTKPRALWLYNKVLEGRKNILSQMAKAAGKKELQEELAKDEIAGLGNLVNRGLPILGADQCRCTKCLRSDLNITDASKTRVCPNCNSLYCTDCYAVRRKCLECDASLQAVLKDIDFYVDSSCDEDENQGD